MVDAVDLDTAVDNRRWNVLVAHSDDDSLLSLEQAFEECNHKVTKCKDPNECLAIFQEKKLKFHLVIIEVSMSGIDGYELSRRVRKETDIPIILLMSKGISSSVPKILEYGATDFIVKPIEANKVRDIQLEKLEKVEESVRGLIRQDCSSAGEVEQEVSAPISRDIQGSADEHDGVTNPCSVEKSSGGSIAALDPPPRKKQRVIWTSELHKKFAAAVNILGLDKAVPKKIMELMNVPDLTRENVASHLQKYRQFQKKKEGEPQPKQPSRRQQENKRSKSNESMSATNELKALYPEPAFPHGSPVVNEPDYKVHGGHIWTDNTPRYLDHPMVSTYEHAPIDPMIGWRQPQYPNYMHPDPEFVDPSTEMCYQIPNETVGNGFVPQCDTDHQLSSYDHYHDDHHVLGLHLVPKIEHDLDHLNLHVVGSSSLQGNTTSCYSYPTASTFYHQQGGGHGHLTFNPTSVIGASSFEHHLYEDGQPSLVEDCQHMFSSAYYDPSLYVDEPGQGGPVIGQPHQIKQEGAEKELGFKGKAEG